MKEFFEEYGFSIVSAIVVIALIAILNNNKFLGVFSESMSALVGSFTGFATDSIPVVG